MGTTEHGIVYPDSDDHTRLWEHFQTLAESADDALAADADAGLVSAWTSMSLTPAPGFTVGTSRYRVILGVLVCLDVVFTRTGSDITATTTGNIPDTLMGSGVPSAVRPSFGRYLNFNRSTFAQGTALLGADGTITAVTLEGNAVLESTVAIHDFYVLG